MRFFKFEYTGETPKKLGRFIQQQGISKQALLRSKYNGGMLLVNQRRRHTSFLLHAHDQIIFLPGEEVVNGSLQPNYVPLQILAETKDYLLIDKPAGLLSIPSKYESKDSVVNRALGYFKKTNQEGVYPHIVTRLDQDTSGIVLVAKTAISHARFASLSKENFSKNYLAIVHGKFTAAHLQGEIRYPLAKMASSIKQHVDFQAGKATLTKYTVLAQRHDAALVKINLLTGRTHQIRVHFQAIGHPLYGDQLYGFSDGFWRQALHANQLTFLDPFMDQWMTYQAKLPQDMGELWARLERLDGKK